MVDVLRRLKLFREGSLDVLWKEVDIVSAKRRPRTRGHALSDAATHLSEADRRTIIGLVEEGALSKAAKHLLSKGLADIDDPYVVLKLRDLHPRGARVPDACDALPASLHVKFEDGDGALDWAKLSWEAVMSFPPGSSPGPNGLRPSHLKDCLLKVGVGSTLQASLAALVEKAVTGALHPSAASFLCASNLIPLKKKDSGIRPIAVGDTLRRLIGKCLLRSPPLKKEIEGLAPRQCGVGVRGAPELVSMSLQRYRPQISPQSRSHQGPVVIFMVTMVLFG